MGTTSSTRVVLMHGIGGPDVLRLEVEAHRYLESNRQVGKIVVTTG